MEEDTIINRWSEYTKKFFDGERAELTKETNL